MITRLSVRSFQSVRKADLELGRLTVVVGASNSGKSALLRAIHMVAHNIASPKDVVSHGAKQTAVVLDIDDGDDGEIAAIGVERGKAKSLYTIDDEQYPKAGTSVPEAVSKILRFSEVEGEDLNFAFQFDRPFLLDVPSSTTAKVLGDLTNVNRIFAAVREANRRLLDVRSQLRFQREQREKLLEEVQRYRTLPDEIKAAKLARMHVGRARMCEEQALGIRKLLAVVDQADALVIKLRQEKPIPTLPDLDEIARKRQTAQTIRSLATKAEHEGMEAQIAVEDVAKIEQNIVNIEADFHERLREAGTCPLCGARQTKR